MAKPGPEEPKGSRILRRVESIMKFEFLLPTQTPAAAPTSVSKPEEKLKKEKKSKKEKKTKEKKEPKDLKEVKEVKEEKERKDKKDSLWKRVSMQLSSPFTSDLTPEEEEVLSTLDPLKEIPTPTSDMGETHPKDRGSIRYTTHDKKAIYQRDLEKLPVTVCTYAERAVLMEQERAQYKPNSDRITPLQDLYGKSNSTPIATVSVRKGSIIENAKHVSTTLEILKSLEAEFEPPPPSSNPPILNRPPSMVLLQQAAQSLNPSDETDKGSVPKPP